MTKWNEIVMVQVSYNVFPMPSLCSLVSALGGALIKHLLTSPVLDPQAISRQYWDQHPHLSFASSSTNRMLVTGHLVSCTLWKTLTYLIFSVLLVATFSLSLNYPQIRIFWTLISTTDLHFVAIHITTLVCIIHHLHLPALLPLSLVDHWKTRLESFPSLSTQRSSPGHLPPLRCLTYLFYVTPVKYKVSTVTRRENDVTSRM